MLKNIGSAEFPDIDKYARSENLNKDILIRAFELENHYHNLLLKEAEPEKRVKLYEELYSQLMPIYGRDQSSEESNNPKAKYVKLFEKELKNGSVVDFGCGQGHFLRALSDKYPDKTLKGIDVFIPERLKSLTTINFEESDIIKYKCSEPYDIAFSDNVLEHLVKEDAETHVRSIYESLTSKGKLIIIMPNRLFGPWDITRIKDFSQSGKTQAVGGHVNESTHIETREVLTRVGFKRFKTILPIPKLKYSIFKNIRLNSSIIEKVEQTTPLLNFIKLVKVNGECIFKLPVVIIAEK